MKREGTKAQGKKKERSKGSHLGTELWSLHNMTTAQVSCLKITISCWLRGVQLLKMPHAGALWLTPSEATCCPCWCTLRARYFVRLYFFYGSPRFTEKLRGKVQRFPTQPLSPHMHSHPRKQTSLTRGQDIYDGWGRQLGESDRPEFQSQSGLYERCDLRQIT